MHHRSSQLRRSASGYRARLLCALTLLAAAVTPAAINAQTGVPKTGAQCLPALGNGNVCTAKDLRVQAVRASGPTACTEGELIDVELEFSISRNSNLSTRAAAQRYTVGYFIGENGEPALQGASCTFSSLVPLAPPLDPAGGAGGYRDLTRGGDACGDIDANENTVHRVRSDRVLCKDDDGDGRLDLDFAVTWNNNANVQCSDPGDETEFFPAQSSRCLLNPGFELDISVENPPSIEVRKEAAPDVVAEPGGPVVFTVAVANRSGAGDTVTLQTLVDDIYGDLDGRGSCAVPQAILPGNVYRCEFVEIVTGLSGDTITNVIEATGSDNEGVGVSGSDSATVTITPGAPPPVPRFSVSKRAQPTSVAEPGRNVTFTIDVTNTGDADLRLEGLSDDRFPGNDLNGAGNCSLPQRIPAAATYSCSFLLAVTGIPGDTVTNTVTATARADLGGAAVTGQDSASVAVTGRTARLLVFKTPSPCCVQEPGGNVTYSVTVLNASIADSITVNTLTDNLYGDLDGRGSCAVPFVLPAGERYSCSFVGPVAGVAGERVTDTITASGVDDDGAPVLGQGGADVIIEALPNPPGNIDLLKSATPAALVAPGGTVTFGVEVINSSEDSDVTLQSLVDDVHGDLAGRGTCSLPQLIPVGGSFTCSFEADVLGVGGDSETDTVTATAVDEDGNVLSAEGSATVDITGSQPSISVTKRPDVLLVAPDSTVGFTVMIENRSEGDQPLVLTQLQDDVYGDLDGQGNCALPQPLPASGSYQCTFAGIVTGPSPGLHRNTVTAVARKSLARFSVSDTEVAGQATAFVVLFAAAGGSGIGIPALSRAALALLALALAVLGTATLRRRMPH